MPESRGDFFADITTAPIFDDALYLSEALLLPVNENEDDLDIRLAVSAREAGIEDPYSILCPETANISTSMSTMSLQSEQRSSVSVHSRDTQSTSFTSQPSRTSRDHAYAEQTPARRTPPPLSRGSLSLDHYDIVMDRFRPNVRHRHSSSAFSASNSILSNASSSRKPATRKHKRGSGLFSMFRKESSTCPSRSPHGHGVKPQGAMLECGHSLSKYAIRIHVQEALDSKEQTAPACCGLPLPRGVLEFVLSSQEVDVVLNSAYQSPEIMSLRDSGYSEDGISISPQSPLTESFPTALNTPNQETSFEEDGNLILVLANEAFQSLRGEQEEQFKRISKFESNQRKALSVYHQTSLTRLASNLETTKAERTKQHALDLERLDESQLVAEHDLRKTHAQEAQNLVTALKYMEAYCSGANPTNPELAHTVTDEDRKKLERQHVIQQKLPAKQESAINVLRAKQERDAKAKLQKHRMELQQLDTDYGEEKQAEEQQYVKDSSRLDAVIQARRTRVIHRWDLRFEIWRRDWENQHGSTLQGRLPHEDWPEATDMEAPITSSSFLALYNDIGS